MVHDPEIRTHQEWLGFLQPVGLVVSPVALATAQAVVNRNILPVQQALERVVREDRADGRAIVPDFRVLASEVLGWEARDLAAPPVEVEVNLPEYGEVLAPTFVVAEPEKAGAWMMFAVVVAPGTDLDTAPIEAGTGWHASPAAKLERLLREREVSIGLLTNGEVIRLLYAPRGETSGHVDFPVQAMREVSGRLILGAFHMLLSADRLFGTGAGRRLPALLAESRRYQNEVSTRLAEQILVALNELLRGFLAADEASGGLLLGEVSRADPQQIYGGLLTTLMRLVFLLYAEDRGMMPADPVYARHYAVTGLYDRLREDAGLYPDTMDQRYGAWAWLLSTFRLVHDGGGHGEMRLPARKGQLFDPDEHAFLEGRPHGVRRVLGDSFDPPRVPDGTIFRVLQSLLVLDGERLSYRALDVEQIGSVYEAMMGFVVERAHGASIGVSPLHVVVDLEKLLAAKPGDRAKVLEEQASCKLTGTALASLRTAKTVDDVVAALGKRVSPRTPRVLPAGALYLQPGEERRRSGSHYTPRSLTEPIVRATLRPVLEALGERPRAEEILALKVCDPAMGSGAFLVEACRHLAERVVAAWGMHGDAPKLPPDQDPLLHARRLVAERCLYGVDKNPFAVALAKLSLWLVTLAKDRAFTFLDHALKHGDSLVGLGRAQIEPLHWAPEGDDDLPLLRFIEAKVKQASQHRAGIHALGEGGDTEKREHWLEAEHALADARLAGDLVVAAFFAGDKDKVRAESRRRLHGQVEAWRAGKGDREALEAIAAGLREGERPVVPFHWELELPEVFGRPNPGFDAIVGNPPFVGGKKISTHFGDAYRDWLVTLHEGANSNADLVAHFFRRAFARLREGGTFGLIATKTIAQGDTRSTGLRWICTHGGTIYSAEKRLKWPGAAAVVVSVVHVRRGPTQGAVRLNGAVVPRITAFLFHAGGHEDPARLAANAGKSFQGSIVLGMGFTFDDDNPEATPIAEMHRLIAKDPRNRERIFPYIGGEEINSSPTHAHRRYVINFGEMTEDEARRWPDLLAIVEQKVRPSRMGLKRAHQVDRWWQYSDTRPGLYRAIAKLDRVVAIARVGEHGSFAILPQAMVYSDGLVVITHSTFAAFAVLQCRPHEVWARFFASSLEDRLRYTPSDCFETFPFPEAWEANARLEAAGRAYYDFRAALMVRNDEGLTKTYNRFHDPDETGADIVKLRDLHAEMDRAVLDAYGWSDLPAACTFELEYEEEEDDAGGKRKKPWRYRWPEEVRDEVLARLLELNQRRAQAERLGGSGGGTPPLAKKPRKVRAGQASLGLFPTPHE